MTSNSIVRVAQIATRDAIPDARRDNLRWRHAGQRRESQVMWGGCGGARLHGVTMERAGFARENAAPGAALVLPRVF